MLCDAHMHVGQFYDKYYSPEWLARLIDELSMGRAAISSTSTCENDSRKVVEEMQEICRLCGDKVVPVLWVTPMFLSHPEDMERLLHCGIQWRCVKIHGALNSGWFTIYSQCMKSALSLAKQLDVPFLFHTGMDEWCSAGYYKRTILQHRRQTFILAHSRPIDQTIEVLRNCPNTFADTAFTPIDDIVAMVDAGFQDRILWGTDVPIPEHFHGGKMNFKAYTGRLLEELHNNVSETAFDDITYKNFFRLFNIEN